MDTILFQNQSIIDFHTHERKNRSTNIIEIVSSTKNQPGLFTYQMHPWDLNSIPTEQELGLMQESISKKNCLGLGEIGLDKIKGPEFSLQQEIVASILSNYHASKPVIFHCVKAFQEIITLSNQYKNERSWAIHGFNKKPELAKQLIDHGFYLSINSLKLKNLGELLEVIPIEKLFLETDDSSISIQDNYIRTAEVLGIELEELKQQIVQNANVFFGHE